MVFEIEPKMNKKKYFLLNPNVAKFSVASIQTGHVNFGNETNVTALKTEWKIEEAKKKF